MANVDMAYGFKPVRYLSGAHYNGAANEYFIPATDGTAVYLGSLVTLAGSADADGVSTVAIAATGDVVIGSVVSVRPLTQDSTIYREASVGRHVMVADDPNLVFSIQEDSVGGDLAATSVGLNADFAVTTGSTATGLSNTELDSSSAATTATLDMQIVGLVNRSDNVIGTNAEWLVRLNNHQLVNQTTGV